MWELDHKESCVLKNWCFQSLVLEKTFESLLDSKEINPINPKGNQPWLFIGRTDAEVETPILWPPNVNIWLIGKDPDAGKEWRLEEKGMTEDEMLGWHHRLNRHESEQTPGDSEGRGSLMCYSPWGHKESDTTELLNNNRALNLMRSSGFASCHFLPRWSWDKSLISFGISFSIYETEILQEKLMWIK